MRPSSATSQTTVLLGVPDPQHAARSARAAGCWWPARPRRAPGPRPASGDIRAVARVGTPTWRRTSARSPAPNSRRTMPGRRLGQRRREQLVDQHRAAVRAAASQAGRPRSAPDGSAAPPAPPRRRAATRRRGSAATAARPARPRRSAGPRAARTRRARLGPRPDQTGSPTPRTGAPWPPSPVHELAPGRDDPGRVVAELGHVDQLRPRRRRCRARRRAPPGGAGALRPGTADRARSPSRTKPSVPSRNCVVARRTAAPRAGSRCVPFVPLTLCATSWPLRARQVTPDLPERLGNFSCPNAGRARIRIVGDLRWRR